MGLGCLGRFGFRLSGFLELKKLKKEKKRLSILVNLIKKDRQIDPVPDCPSLSHDNTAGLDTKRTLKVRMGKGD